MEHGFYQNRTGKKAGIAIYDEQILWIFGH